MSQITDTDRINFLASRNLSFDSFFRQGQDSDQEVKQVLDSLDGEVLGEGLDIRQAIDDAMTSPAM